MQSKLPADKKWQNTTFLGALKAGVASGEFVQNKASYKLSADFKKKISKPAPAPKKKPAAKKAAEGTKKKAATGAASKKKPVKKAATTSEVKPKVTEKKVTKNKAPTEKNEKKAPTEKKAKAAKPVAEKKKVCSLPCFCTIVPIANQLTWLVSFFFALV